MDGEGPHVPGLSVGILGAGGVGIATAGAIIQQGLAGRVTLYDRTETRARGEALDYLHALPLLPRTEIRGCGLGDIGPEDVLVCTIGHHTKPGETRLELLQANLEITAAIAEAVEHGGLPRVFLMVTNPLDVLTEYLTRRWADRPVAVMGSGTCLDTLRFTELLARQCGVHPRSVHAWVIGEHGDSAVFLHSSATIGAIPFPTYAQQRGIDVTPVWTKSVEDDVRSAAYQVRELKGSAVHGIGLAVSGLVRCIGRESGTIIPVSVRVEDRLCASVPCALGPDGPSEPLWPLMDASETTAWEHSLDVLRAAGEVLPF
jgi:L-lactate dehydrogenase